MPASRLQHQTICICPKGGTNSASKCVRLVSRSHGFLETSLPYGAVTCDITIFVSADTRQNKSVSLTLFVWRGLCKESLLNFNVILVTTGSIRSRTNMVACWVYQMQDCSESSFIVFGGAFSCSYIRKWSLGSMSWYGHSTG